jgi:hypothetical protein
LGDYAGLFPPASQDMRAAVESYASYLSGADRAYLGRFIVPISRLQEFSNAASGLLPRGPESEPWRLSVLLVEVAENTREQLLSFNRAHLPGNDRGHAIIESVEAKATTGEEVGVVRAAVPSQFVLYIEIPLSGDPLPLVQAIGAAHARAKVRTGGVTADAFPHSRSLLDFIAACNRAHVAFKATAGLHHPLRGSYRLTYEPGSEQGVMYGYLNVFLAAAVLATGATEDVALQVLEEGDPSAFSFGDESICWRDHEIMAADIRSIRENVAISFGSCSFREPVDEIAELTSSTANR